MRKRQGENAVRQKADGIFALRPAIHKQTVGWLSARAAAVVLFFLLLALGSGVKPSRALQGGEDGLREITAAALWQAAERSRDRRAIARLLQQAIRSGGDACAWVSDYQIVDRSTNRLLFKVKCPGMPLYGVRIERDTGFRMRVVGGDGLVGPFSPADGEIVSFDHPPAEGLFTSDQTHQSQKDAAHPRLWILVTSFVSVLVGLAIVAAIVIAVVAAARRAKPLPPLDSTQKNALMLESREVLPNIYRHPDGFYIVRGRHGRRRIFPWLATALLYRDLGIRVFEHRAFSFSGRQEKG